MINTTQNREFLGKHLPENATLREAVTELLWVTGNDVEREGLQDTPDRVARLYRELFVGLDEDPGWHLETVFTTTSSSMIVIKDIPYFSVCEHHLVPFHGVAHIGYIPGKLKDDPTLHRIAGLSKFARVVEGFSRRPQVQENLTEQITECIQSKLAPAGTIVVVQGEHLCMSMRGIQKQGSKTITSSVRGMFDANVDGCKDEFLQLLAMD